MSEDLRIKEGTVLNSFHRFSFFPKVIIAWITKKINSEKLI